MNKYHITFWDVVSNSGSIGMLMWFFIFIFSATGLVLGFSSVISSLKVKKEQYPIAFKLLICCMFATLLFGMQGTLTEYVDSFAKLGTTTGAAKAEAFELSTICAEMNMIFVLYATLIQIFCVVASLVVIEKRAIELSLDGLRIKNQLIKISYIVYITVALMPPVIFGVYSAVRGIKMIITQKPDGPLPTIAGFVLPSILQFSLICSLSVTVLIVLFLVQTTFKHIKKRS